MKPLMNSRTKIARQYGITLPTLNNLLIEFTTIKINPKRRTLTPKEVEEIYVCLGPPEEYQKT